MEKGHRPPEEVEAFAHKEECLLPRKERLPRTRDVLVGGILRKHGERHADVFAEVIMNPDEVE